MGEAPEQDVQEAIARGLVGKLRTELEPEGFQVSEAYQAQLGDTLDSPKLWALGVARFQPVLFDCDVLVGDEWALVGAGGNLGSYDRAACSDPRFEELIPEIIRKQWEQMRTDSL